MSEIYFKAEDDNVPSKSIQGGSKIKMYAEDNKLTYPLILLTCDRPEVFRLEALKGLLDNETFLKDENKYTVYFQIKDKLLKVGLLARSKLKALLKSKVFDVFTKTVMLDKDITVEGDLLYALCTVIDDTD